MQEHTKPQLPHDAEELAFTAGKLLDNLKHEENPKFRHSQFMGLMKQLRDREVLIDGNRIVENDGTTRIVDDKGKAKVAAQVPLRSHPSSGSAPVYPSTMQKERNTLHVSDQELGIEQEDPNVAYFRQENEDFIAYWNAKPAPAIVSKDAMFWDNLQEDWDKFETTAAGITAEERYQFQSNNPYLLGDSSRTRHHLLHTGQSEVGALRILWKTSHIFLSERSGA